jgi:hypothetical protein
MAARWLSIKCEYQIRANAHNLNFLKSKGMTMDDMASERISFSIFYRDHFIPEHSHPINVALHVFGTLAGLGLITLSISIIPIWWMLLFPLVHVAPGLIGHRLFDRNEAVGDARVFRTDFPLWWFVVANHRMTASLLFTLKK